jgi:hypothetical protein
MIAIYYDYETKKEFLPKEYHTRLAGNVITLKLVKLLSSIIESKNSHFIIRLRDSKYSWQPNFLNNRPDDLKRKNYLEKQNWEKTKYFGKFVTKDIQKFLELFVKFPKEYSYQDILILNKLKDMLIVLSYHGTIWIIDEDKKYLKEISKLFEEIGAIVVPSRNM